MSRARMALLTVSLLLVSATAHAECSWVLWGQAVQRVAGEPEWDAETAAESLAGCKAAMADRLRFWREAGAQTTDHSWSMSGKDAASKAWNRLVGYRCLPDTIDPRGARSK